MQNDDLTNSSEINRLQRRISALENQIAAFKEYDEQRKLYYRNIVQRCGELESYVAELEDTDANIKRINDLKATAVSQNRIIRLNQLRTDIPKEEEERLLQAHQIKSLLNKLSKQGAIIKRLRESQSELIIRLNKLERQGLSDIDVKAD